MLDLHQLLSFRPFSIVIHGSLVFIRYLCVYFLQSKLKKIQEKYGDQDEEERELRLQLLAVISLNQSINQSINQFVCFSNVSLFRQS